MAPERFRQLRSLRVAILAPLVLGGILSATLVVGLQYRTLNERLVDELTMRARALARSIQLAADSVDEAHEIQRFVAALGAEPGVDLIVVAGGDPARVIASTTQEIQDRALDDIDCERLVRSVHEAIDTGGAHYGDELSADGVDYTAPVRISEIVGGSVRTTRGAVLVHLDDSLFAATLSDEAMRTSIVLVLLITAASILLYGFLDRRIVRRVDSVARTLRRQSRGEKSARTGVKGSDELGYLARTLNEMLDRFVERESRLHAIFETAVDAIVVVDRKGKLCAFNPAAERMFGYGFEEVLRRPLSLLVADPQRAEIDAHVDRNVDGGVRSLIGTGREMTGRRKNGSTFPIDLSLGEMTIGTEVFFTGIIRDISQRKETERDLRDYATALEVAGDLAHAAAKAKSHFLANMSHEIRTPMTAILGYLDLLHSGDVTEKEREETIETIHRNGQHLLSVINDILDLSKVETGELTVENIEADLPKIILDIETLWRPRAEKAGLELVTELASPIPRTVRTDPPRVKQILMNLIGNAVKFTNEGSVRIRVGMSADGRRVRFDVVDTGIGISESAQKCIFVAFDQGDGSSTRRFGGTGLGLSISRHLARLLGGDITVESEVGVGSTFSFEFDPGAIESVPRIESLCPAEEAPRAERDETEPFSARILVAEDNPTNQMLVKRILTKAGHEVTITENGALAMHEALAQVEKGSPYDAILMDMLMPEMDGYTATRELRKLRYDGLIIALTANAMEGDREKCLNAGCDHYLTKPVNRAKLLELLETTITERREAAVPI